MSNPTARQPIKSVVPSVEVELDGRAIPLRYNFKALHEAGANPFDGSLVKLTTNLTPENGAHFILCGMTEQDRAEFRDKIQDLLAPNTAVEVIGAISKQIDETLVDSGLVSKETGDRPPVA